jgi:hypothetical protein
MTPIDCGINDQSGYACGQLGSDGCADCGTTLCTAHAEACEFCLQVFCNCCLYFHLKESHTRKPVPAWVVPERKSA